jgi:hypothetical protein
MKNLVSTSAVLAAFMSALFISGADGETRLGSDPSTQFAQLNQKGCDSECDDKYSKCRKKIMEDTRYGAEERADQLKK